MVIKLQIQNMKLHFSPCTLHSLLKEEFVTSGGPYVRAWHVIHAEHVNSQKIISMHAETCTTQ